MGFIFAVPAPQAGTFLSRQESNQSPPSGATLFAALPAPRKAPGLVPVAFALPPAALTLRFSAEAGLSTFCAVLLRTPTCPAANARFHAPLSLPRAKDRCLPSVASPFSGARVHSTPRLYPLHPMRAYRALSVSACARCSARPEGERQTLRQRQNPTVVSLGFGGLGFRG